MEKGFCVTYLTVIRIDLGQIFSPNTLYFQNCLGLEMEIVNNFKNAASMILNLRWKWSLFNETSQRSWTSSFQYLTVKMLNFFISWLELCGSSQKLANIISKLKMKNCDLFGSIKVEYWEKGFYLTCLINYIMIILTQNNVELVQAIFLQLSGSRNGN